MSSIPETQNEEQLFEEIIEPVQELALGVLDDWLAANAPAEIRDLAEQSTYLVQCWAVGRERWLPGAKHFDQEIAGVMGDLLELVAKIGKGGPPPASGEKAPAPATRMRDRIAALAADFPGVEQDPRKGAIWTTMLVIDALKDEEQRPEVEAALLAIYDVLADRLVGGA